jgi:hypothetical protein
MSWNQGFKNWYEGQNRFPSVSPKIVKIGKTGENRFKFKIQNLGFFSKNQLKIEINQSEILVYLPSFYSKPNRAQKHWETHTIVVHPETLDVVVTFRPVTPPKPPFPQMTSSMSPLPPRLLLVEFRAPEGHLDEQLAAPAMTSSHPMFGSLQTTQSYINNSY